MVQRLTEFYRCLGASRDEWQRQGSAEELYGFASSHIRTREKGTIPDLMGANRT